MIVLRSSSDGADVRLTSEELEVLNSVIRELASGVDLHPAAFQARVGWTKERTRELGMQIHALAYPAEPDRGPGM